MNRKFSRYTICLLIPFFLCVTHFSYAEETSDGIKISLQECIALALESNLDIRIQRLSPQIQNALVTKAESHFDPTATFSASIDSSEDPNLIEANSLSGNSQRFNISVTDPIATGGSYGLSFNSNRSKNNPDDLSYRSGLSFDVTQPLLEGFGIATNKASITIAKNNKQISNLRLKSQLIKTLSEVQNAYWELVFARENLEVQQLALKQAEELLKKNRRFKEAEKATESDILQAQSAVASRMADVISAEDAVKDAEDQLKQVTNMIEDDAQWDTSIVPVDSPSFEELEVNLEEAIGTALQNRSEYTQAKIELGNSDLSIKVAKNQRLPRLDLEGSLSLNGLGDELGEPFSQVGKADYDTWSVGLFLRVPLNGRSTKAELEKNQFEKKQALLALKELETQIVDDVRSAVRQLETNKKRIDATKAAENFAKLAIAVEEKKHELGMTTSYELLQMQANLATATKNRLRAGIDHRKSIVALYQALGVTTGFARFTHGLRFTF